MQKVALIGPAVSLAARYCANFSIAVDKSSLSRAMRER